MQLFGLALPILIGLSSGCSQKKNAPQQPAPDPRVTELRSRYQQALDEALSLRNPANGWLVEDCDGMLWTGVYAASSGVREVNVGAAEYPDQPGRFQRRPAGCPVAATDTTGSTWSRDMGIGLLAYAWRHPDLALLERHIAYGHAHNWQMGEPLGDGRSVYTPSMIGKVFETAFALGGGDDANRFWPDLYPMGLTDYQAHLQVMSIWHRGEVDTVIRTKGEHPSPGGITDDSSSPKHARLPLNVSDDALSILKEQAARDPRDPLFQATLGTYTGDMGPAITACLADDWYCGEYCRAGDGATERQVTLAGWIFACDLVLRAYH